MKRRNFIRNAVLGAAAAAVLPDVITQAVAAPVQKAVLPAYEMSTVTMTIKASRAAVAYDRCFLGDEAKGKWQQWFVQELKEDGTAHIKKIVTPQQDESEYEERFVPVSDLFPITCTFLEQPETSNTTKTEA